MIGDALAFTRRLHGHCYFVTIKIRLQRLQRTPTDRDLHMVVEGDARADQEQDTR